MAHTLFPLEVQDRLISASKTAQMDSTIKAIQAERPGLFHTEQSLLARVFQDQPRGHYSGTFVVPAPVRVYESTTLIG
jgi:hypothetical protein